jgi:hypothetical protein
MQVSTISVSFLTKPYSRMRALFKVLPLIFALCLLCCPAGRAGFVVPVHISGIPVPESHPGISNHPRYNFQSMYPGKSKAAAILLALPGISMLGMYAFYLGQEKYGIIHLLCDILGTIVLFIVLSPSFNILGFFGFFFGLYIGGGLLALSFIGGMIALFQILFNAPITPFRRNYSRRRFFTL